MKEPKFGAMPRAGGACAKDSGKGRVCHLRVVQADKSRGMAPNKLVRMVTLLRTQLVLKLLMDLQVK